MCRGLCVGLHTLDDLALPQCVRLHTRISRSVSITWLSPASTPWLPLAARLRSRALRSLPDHPAGAPTRTKSTRAAQEHLAQNQTCFHCLAGAHIVGDQQVDPRKAQCLAQRQKLVSVLMDASPEGGLEKVSVGSGRSIPAERAQVGGENARVVGSELRDAGPALDSRRTFCATE